VSLAVLAALLAGCSGGDGEASASFTPTFTASLPSGGATVSSPSVTPSATGPRSTELPSGVATTGQNVLPGDKPPTLPESALTDDFVGAMAFADYWDAAVDWSIATQDTKLARGLFADSCAHCETFMTFVEQAKKVGNSFIGGRRAPIRTEKAVNDGRYGAVQAIALTMLLQALQVRSPSGQVVGSDPAQASELYGVWLAWRNGGWTVVDWGHN
jgi:hypothetical protein